MIKNATWGMRIAAVTVAVGLFATGALAQQAPGTTSKAPVTAPPAAKAPPTAPAVKKPAKKTTDSACKGLEQAACAANADCQYIAATKRKDGKDVKAYCRTKPKSKTAKTAPAPVTSPPTTTKKQ